MRAAIFLSAALAGLGAASAARAELVDFHLVSHSVTVNRAHQAAVFSLTFDREPRFSFHTAAGEQPNAFQYEIDIDRTIADEPILFDDIDTVIRGAEIASSNAIPIRDRDGEGGSNAGGWGPVRTTVPYDLEGNTLTFAAPLSAIGDDDGRFRYRIITTDNGGLTTDVQGAVIPLPAAVWSGLAMLGGVGILTKVRGAMR